MIVIGGIFVAFPIIQLVVRCFTASDVTYELARPGNMWKGLLIYLCSMAIGGALIASGIFLLT